MESLETIKKRVKKWMPDDNFGIGHPIFEDELEEDVRYLVQIIEEHQDRIDTIQDSLGLLVLLTTCATTKKELIKLMGYIAHDNH